MFGASTDFPYRSHGEPDGRVRASDGAALMAARIEKTHHAGIYKRGSRYVVVWEHHWVAARVPAGPIAGPPSRSCLRPFVDQLLLDLLDELEMQREEAAQEVDDEQQVLLAVGKLSGRTLGVVEARLDVGEVLPKRCHRLPRGRLTDEVADQEAQ
jgi:hypothetical protein